jgi:hypothetical protein
MNLDSSRIDKMRATDLLHAYGINHWHIPGPVAYLQGLHKLGVLGPGKKIECDLPFGQFNKLPEG